MQSPASNWLVVACPTVTFVGGDSVRVHASRNPAGLHLPMGGTGSTPAPGIEKHL